MGFFSFHTNLAYWLIFPFFLNEKTQIHEPQGYNRHFSFMFVSLCANICSCDFFQIFNWVILVSLKAVFDSQNSHVSKYRRKRSKYCLNLWTEFDSVCVFWFWSRFQYQWFLQCSIFFSSIRYFIWIGLAILKFC